MDGAIAHGQVSNTVNMAMAIKDRVMSMTERSSTQHQYNGDNDHQQKLESAELYQNWIEITGDLDSSQTRLLLDRMQSLANTMRSEGRRGKYRAAGVELSTRETEVLILVSHGYTRRDVAQSLGITANTASRHISNIYAKLGVSCVAEATAFALRHNIAAMDL